MKMLNLTRIFCLGMSGGRERCDSMPSRARTTSEGIYPGLIGHIRGHLVPHRPQSLYAREISHSPPAGSPASPASASASATDSAGSSLSIDEPDAWIEYTDQTISRYGHSLTPDEPIAEENPDEGTDNAYVPLSPHGSPLTGGYVPMAPLSSDDGYVDMSPRGRHTEMSPAASTCSITSGTPSTDMRFSEYHLEKVSSYFTPSEEDDTSSAERPIRAYSVGSRPEATRTFKSKVENSSHLHDNPRVRAFSVGSRSRGLPNRILPPHGQPPCTGPKSSSAPLLNQNSLHGSHSSMEPMDDLMEMDFSRPSNNSGYLDMSPRTRATPAGYVEMKPGISDNTPTTPDLPYMDMRPSVSPMKLSNMSLHSEPPKDHPYLDMRPVSSPMKPSSSPLQCPATTRDTSGYMDMRPSTSPHKPSTVQPANKYNPYYMEMGGTKLGSSPKSNKTASPIQEEYMDMDFNSSRNNTPIERSSFTDRPSSSGAARTQPVDLPQNKKSPEGYLEMSWGTKHQRKSSLDSVKVSAGPNEDYVNMSAKRKDRRGSKKEKTRSQPITIQNRNNQNVPSSKIATSQSPSSFTTYTQSPGRKNSTGNSPKHPPSFLPLVSSSYSPSSSPFSSLRRPRSRKNSRRDSKDSTTSGLVTPTSDQSTIFPFSPGSPVKPFHMKSPDLSCSRKCAVDASSGTVRIANTAGKPPQSGDFRMNYDCQQGSSSQKSDYLEMGFDSSKPVNLTEKSNEMEADIPAANDDYINFCPANPRPQTSSSSSDDYGEYAVMRPINTVTSNPKKGSAPFSNIHTIITKQLSGLTMIAGNTKPCVFKPIVEPKEENRLGTISPRPGDVAPHRSYENLRSGTESAEDSSRSESLDGNYETLRGGSCISPVAKISRPNSVNSDKLSRNNSRPGSVSSDKSNISRPSSVSSEVKGTLSRPSSVSSELGSTTSTIVGSRPESVNADLNRPPSVSSEREIHYASLDLAPTDDDGTRSPRGKNQTDSTRSPTPSSSTEPCFTYAEIDFAKSENMKQNILNAKVKH